MPWPEDPGSLSESHHRSVLRASSAKSLRFLHVGFVSVKALADCNKHVFGAVPALKGVRSPLRPTGFSVYASPVLFIPDHPELRHRRNTRYGWVVNPFPVGTYTRQDAPSFAWRANGSLTRGGFFPSPLKQRLAFRTILVFPCIQFAP